jgi:hypothetical protein
MATDEQNELSEKFSGKKALWITCGLIVALLLGAIFSCPIIKIDLFPFAANPNSAEDTTQAFAYSLAYNKLDHIKSYVSRNKWAFIESWPARHQPVSSRCKDYDDPDLGPFTISSYDSAESPHLISFFFMQDCPNHDYIFSVDGVIVERVENRWKISDWEKICEVMTVEVCY